MGRTSFIFAVLGCALALGCTNVSRNGGDVGPGGVDVSGTWEIAETLGSNDCGEAPGSTTVYDVRVEQSGSTLTVHTPAGTFSGQLRGRQLNWSGSYPQSGGVTTVTGNHIEVDAAGETLSGSSNWTWAGEGFACSGTSSVSGVRVGAPRSSTPPPEETGTGDICFDEICNVELASCGGSCVALFECLNACNGSDPCIDSCIASAPEQALGELGALLSCVSERCPE